MAEQEIIKARVWQKVATEAEWNANPLILGPGEPAWVVSNGGVGINVKIGTGDKRFSDLEYFIQTEGAPQKADTSTVFPPDTPGLYIPTESGTYNGVTVDLSVGYVQLIWDGSTLTKVEFPIDLAGYATIGDIDGQIQQGETKAPNGNTVFGQLDPYLVLPQDVTFELYAGDGTFTASGSYRPSVNWVSTRLIPVDPAGEDYYMEGFSATGNKRILYYAEADTLHQSPLIVPYPTGITQLAFTSPSGYSEMIISVAAGTNVGSDIPNSPYWDTFKLSRGGERRIKTDMIKDRIDSEQLLTIESKLDGLETAGTNFVGAGAPPYMYGLDNATYMDSVTGRLYTKTDGVWDNGITPLGFEFEQTYPADFTFQPGTIYRQKNGSYQLKGYENITTIVQDTIRSMTPTYIDPVNGDNSNPGTLEAPMRGINAALSAGKRLIVLRGGIYPRTYGIDQYSDPAGVTDPLIILPYQNEKAHLLSADPATMYTWSADDNVYSTARTNVRSVLNTDSYSRDTGYQQYDRADSLSTCKSTPFSWYTDNTNVWINTNGGAPGTNIMIGMRMPGFNTFTFTDAPFVYIEGMDIYVHSAPGSLCVRSSNVEQSDVKVYLKNLRGYDNREGNVFSIESVKEAYVQNLYGWSSLRDAINYHTSYAGYEKMKFVEINGSSLDTGRNTTSEFSSNGSTAHDGITGIRLGGSFDTARGGVVIDVNPGTYTLNYGVQAKNPMLPSPSLTAAFHVQNEAVTRLFGCYAKGDRALTAETDATMYVDQETVVQGSINGNVITE